ncbi:hypothetical protein C8Q76DRAFT_59446 [Earliella scabrosa]|nr:hypothetical protein C8Q76DRAFT_59446 [Earliella scabrosa]
MVIAEDQFAQDGEPGNSKDYIDKHTKHEPETGGQDLPLPVSHSAVAAPLRTTVVSKTVSAAKAGVPISTETPPTHYHVASMLSVSPHVPARHVNTTTEGRGHHEGEWVRDETLNGATVTLPLPLRSAELSSRTPYGIGSPSPSGTHDLAAYRATQHANEGRAKAKLLSWACRLCLQNPCLDPITTFCGHLFCHSCIMDKIATGTGMACPVCDQLFLVRLHVT